MDIRLAQNFDRQKLEDFLVLNGGEQWRSLAKKYIACMFSEDFRKPIFFLALDDTSIIGCAAFSEEFFTVDVWGISWVNVHADWRGQGIGQKLVRACLDEIQKNVNAKVTVILNTYPGKTGLYDKTGFNKSGEDHHGGSLMLRCLESRAA